MNKEQQKLLDDVYEKYCKESKYNFLISKDAFINSIKRNLDFAEEWGLKIEERELSLEERVSLFSKNVNGEHLMKYADSDGLDMWNKILNEDNIPTKLITITYNNETIESYEHTR